jgi:putative endonuclease
VNWFLYVIECRDGSLYTGIAIDPEARFTAHLAGKGARYTRSHPPLRLIASMPYPDRSSASKAEYKLKQLPASEKLRVARGEASLPLEEETNPPPLKAI